MDEMSWSEWRILELHYSREIIILVDNNGRILEIKKTVIIVDNNNGEKAQLTYGDLKTDKLSL